VEVLQSSLPGGHYKKINLVLGSARNGIDGAQHPHAHALI